MLWAGMSGEVDFNKIVGFAVQSQAVGTLDIVDVSVNWNGSADAAKAVDTTAPEFKYQGEMTINAKAGDPVPTFEGASAYDKNDGVVDVIVEWSDGAVTDGKLNEGTHTAKLYAKDAAGNACEAYNITVKVEKNGSPVDSSSGSADSGSASDSSSEKGCASAVATLPAMLSLLGFAVVYSLAETDKLFYDALGLGDKNGNGRYKFVKNCVCLYTNEWTKNSTTLEKDMNSFEEKAITGEYYGKKLTTELDKLKEKYKKAYDEAKNAYTELKK